MFRGLDHLAIVVPDTQEALRIWRDRLGFPVLFEESVQDGTVRLTHLDLGNTQLQLVEPLTPDHPLRDWLARHGSGLHHLCLALDDLEAGRRELEALGLPPAAAQPHEGTQGRRALFLDRTHTGNVLVELSGA